MPDALIEESFSASTVSCPIERVGSTFTVPSSHLHSDEYMARIDADVKWQMERHCHERKVGHEGFVWTLMGEAIRKVVESSWEKDVEVPARRRWWQVLLFRHPTRWTTQTTTLDGYFAGADYYKVAWQQNAVECPPDGVEMVRHWDPRGQYALKFAVPSAPAWATYA